MTVRISSADMPRWSMSRLSSKSNWAKRIFRLHTLKLMHTIPTTTPTRETKAISATATSQGFAEKISSTSGPPVSEGTSEYSPAAAGTCADFRTAPSPRRQDKPDHPPGPNAQVQQRGRLGRAQTAESRDAGPVCCNGWLGPCLDLVYD